MTCRWCGQVHELGELCREAPRGLSRRSFLFLGAAAAIGAMLPARAMPAVGRAFDATRLDPLLKDIYQPGIQALLTDASYWPGYLAVHRDWVPIYERLTGTPITASVPAPGGTYNDVVRSTEPIRWNN